MAGKPQTLCRVGHHPKKAGERCAICRRASERSRKPRPISARIPAGTPKRDAYNEKRRVARKAAALAELEASRKHREGLREFLRRKAA